MARIRTVKPEFWTSEQVMELSPIARLAFVGMWNFCDDQGVHPASAKTLKAEVFPADDIPASDVQAMVDQMIQQGLIKVFESAGKPYWWVTGWIHQKIDKPTNKYPKPDFSATAQQPLSDDSASPRLVVGEPSPPEGKGREEEGKGLEPLVLSLSADDQVCSDESKAKAEQALSCPATEIVALYHAAMPNNPRCKVLNDARKRAIRQRWKEGQRCQTSLLAIRHGLPGWRRGKRFLRCAPSLLS